MEIKIGARGVRLIEVAIIGGASFLFYHWSNPTPPDWYKHFVYLAQAFLGGRLDLRGLPDFYHDIVRVNGKIFVPFPPMPAVVMLPAVALWGTAASQAMVGKLVGAVNVGLMWLILGKLGVEKRLQWLLTLFFGFGTVHWYAAVWGTTWFFAHVVAVMWLLLALLAFFSNKSALLVGLLVGAAALSREPVIGAAVFFGLMWWQKRERKKMGWFSVGVGTMVGLLLTYNFLRFGNIWDEGYGPIVEGYRRGGYPYTILLKYFPNAPRFEFLDWRNIPLHLYTLLVMPPEINKFVSGEIDEGQMKPSPYGMSLVLTSPLLLFLLGRPLRRRWVFWASLAAVGVTSMPILLHYTQGWVQFGYRFALDLMPFLIIMLALRMEKVTRLSLLLTAVSIGVNWWGVEWAKRLGW